MALGLAKKNVPIFVDGGIDTKSNPKLVRGPALLELENMYQLRTGELRVRNGFSRLLKNITAGGSATEVRGLVRMPQTGGLGEIFSSSANAELYNFAPYVAAQGIGDAGVNTINPNPGPIAIANISQVTSEVPLTATFGTGAPRDYTDADMAVAANGMATFAAQKQLPAVNFQAFSALWDANGSAAMVQLPSLTSIAAGSVSRCALGGTTYLCNFRLDTAGVPSLVCTVVQSTAAGGVVGIFTVALNAVSAAQPWYDVKPIPGGNLIAVAYRANAGGVTCCIFNPATGAVTSSVTTAAADATMCLGWLDDSLVTGNAYLATAGSTAGVVVRTMSNATMVVSATNVIDATALANVRNITGYINTSATNYVTMWSVEAAPTYNRLIKKGAWTGAAAVSDFCRGMNLVAGAFKYDGLYYVVGGYDSTTQAAFSVMPTGASYRSSCIFARGYAGGGRFVNSALATVTVGATANVFYFAATILQRTVAANGTFSLVRGGAAVKLTFLSQLRTRSLGSNSLFLPGGILWNHDGKRIGYVGQPLAVEAVSGVSSATGSMTASGAYSYVCVYRSIGSDGRVHRSPQSVPVAVTLGAGDGRVTLTISTLRIYGIGSGLGLAGMYPQIDVYRAGPAAAGATGYNKVGEVGNDPSVDTVSFVDTMSDTNANAGEFLYTTGNVLDSFTFPPCEVIETCGTRLWAINEEDPSELRFSKEYKAGVGLGGNPLLGVRVDGDGFGRLTALASMDGRIVAFKSNAIYVISGEGPNDNGQGTFSQPQAASLSAGTSLPASVISTPDGIMFQGAKGIYLLDRGLGLTYLGAPVEQYTLAENVVDASLVDSTTQVRFVTASGRCLVWDYHHKRWYTFQLRADTAGVGSTVVACANIASGWCYALADGSVMQEVAGATVDVSTSSTTITPRISFPHLDFGGLAGYQRFYGLDITVDVIGNHTLSVDAEYDYSGAVTGTPRTKALTTATPTAQVEYNPPEGKAKCTAVRPVLTISGAALTGSFRLTGVTARIGIKQGTNVPAISRLT